MYTLFVFVQTILSLKHGFFSTEHEDYTVFTKKMSAIKSKKHKIAYVLVKYDRVSSML